MQFNAGYTTLKQLLESGYKTPLRAWGSAWDILWCPALHNMRDLPYRADATWADALLLFSCCMSPFLPIKCNGSGHCSPFRSQGGCWDAKQHPPQEEEGDPEGCDTHPCSGTAAPAGQAELGSVARLQQQPSFLLLKRANYFWLIKFEVRRLKAPETKSAPTAELPSY